MPETNIDPRYEKSLEFVRRELPEDSHRECCWANCEKKYTDYELAAALVEKKACITTWMHKVFCYPECYEKYRASEGF